MINPVPHIRASFYNLLNGQIVYDGATVPVSEGEGEPGKYNIIIAETTCNNRSTKDDFMFNCTQLIEVISELMGTSATKHVDVIGGEVVNAVQPFPRITAALSDEFQFLNLRLQDQRYLRERGSDNSRIVRLQLRYEFIINQKTI